MSEKRVKITWKRIVAAVLVMAALIAMSSIVSAGFMEPLFDETFEVMVASSSQGPPSSIIGWSTHAMNQMAERNMGQDYLEFIFNDGSPTWNEQHQSWNYTDGTATICVNSAGWVTTVYWNY